MATASTTFRLDGARAGVTGAGSGLGQAAALGLSEAGATAILVGRTQATLDATRRAIEDQGGQARCLVCDVTDAAQVRDRIDILDNALNIPEDFVQVSEANLDHLLGLTCPRRWAMSACRDARSTA